MKVLLLAAGKSNRMRPMTDKNFLDFLGKPLIVRQLEMIKSAGFNEIVIVGGAHNLSALRDVCDGLDMQIDFCQQGEEIGMRAAVIAARDFIIDHSVLIVSSNDVVDDLAFDSIKEAISSGNSDGYILGKHVNEYFPGGYLVVSDDGIIDGIVEKPTPGTEPSNLVNLVIHYHKRADILIEYLKKAESTSDDLYEAALDKMFTSGLEFKVVPYEGFWQPIKFPWHVHKVFRYFFDKATKGIGESSHVSDTAVINGEVVIGDNVKIFDGAIINGPVYLGDGCVIANNALVRDSHVGNGCVVGFSTEIARSYLGSDVWMHTNYIGDSVLGNNISFGSGTVTGNLRLDEKNVYVDCDGKRVNSGSPKFGLVCGNNVRVGVNTSFMPGVKVGFGSFVGAGIVVSEDVPDRSFVRGTWDIKISENLHVVDANGRDDMKGKLGGSS